MTVPSGSYPNSTFGATSTTSPTDADPPASASASASVRMIEPSRTTTKRTQS
ncbi:MAG: hypothetical protein ACK4MD_00090 [Demequina sp.]|uniref:hypothetical protein n=1 Tax=Microbacterium schleiferi TaxID=69362 RepID=UPI001D173B2C|nr:hypothetical protein [Microbacterium schleiferi]